jgi:hypothetical protein
MSRHPQPLRINLGPGIRRGGRLGGNVRSGRRFSPYTIPTVRRRARGWISFWLITTVWPRKRSMIERT